MNDDKLTPFIKHRRSQEIKIDTRTDLNTTKSVSDFQLQIHHSIIP